MTPSSANGWPTSCVRREIVASQEALEPDALGLARTIALLAGTSLNELVASDAAARAFVNSPLGHDVLRIPAGAQVVLEPRLVVAKDYYHRSPDGVVWAVTVREGLLKVWWMEWEEGGSPPAACPPRQIAVGTTLSWDWDSGRAAGTPHDRLGPPAGRVRPSGNGAGPGPRLTPG